MRREGTFIVSLLAVVVAVMLTASPALAGDQSDLAGRAKAWEKAFNAGNADAVAALYTEDGMRLPYQAPAVKGRAAIPANIQTSYDAGIAKVKLEVLGAESQGNMGWGHGTYVLTDAEGVTVQQGKWMNVSKKVNGKWLIHCDIWNSDAP